MELAQKLKRLQIEAAEISVKGKDTIRMAFILQGLDEVIMQMQKNNSVPEKNKDGDSEKCR